MLTPLLATVVLALPDAALPPLDLTALAQLDYRFSGEIGPLELGAPIAPDAIVEEIADEAIAKRFGARDSWRWTVSVAYGDNFSDTDLLLGGVGVSWFAADDLSLNFEFNAVAFSQPVDDATGFTLVMMIRWHFLPRDTWSLFADMGIGFMVSTDDVPEDSSDFNFNPRMGLGGSVELSEDVRLMLGARWYHVSNGRVFRDNPGIDAVEFWAGLSVGF